MPSEAAAELAPIALNEPLTITLSPELSERIRVDIAIHGFPNPLAVVEDAFRIVDEKDEELEPWMVQEIIEACEEYDRDPSQGRTSEQVRLMLEEEYRLSLKAG
jgi:coenzyme F420-reducing hydrogenase gamma subunit